MSMKDSANEAMWGNDPGRLAKAREAARRTPNELAADSIMLSAYYTVLGPTGRFWEKLQAVLCISDHANPLIERWRELDCNQLDVLVSFLLKVPKWFAGFMLNSCDLSEIACREWELAKTGARVPHQLALAHVTYAQVLMRDSTLKIRPVMALVEAAITLGPQIRKKI